MEASNVLKEYLELFTADCRQLKLLVAPNAAVDWFGRTVRGPAKIHDYFRFEVATQYEHADFDKAEECQPIEQRPSHWKTKSLPSEEADFVLPINKVTGLTTLKTYADSDIEDDDLEMLPLSAGNCTPEPHSNSTAHIGELTPPSSTIKIEDINATDSESDLDEAECASAPKRLKRSIPTPFSYLRRIPTSSSKITHVAKRQLPQFDIQMLGDDTSSDEELDVELRKMLAKEYTPLKYIEATGKLRAKPQMLSAGDSPPTPHRSSDWDRSVRLRISYRRNLADKSLQIALVIYEHLQSPTADVNQDAPSTLGMRRRNLMTQFNETALSETPHAAQQDVHDMESSIALTEVGTAVPLTDVDEESTAISVVPLRTPTKSDHTPPATPKRRPRVPYTLSGMKRMSPSSTSTATPKRNAARSLRL
ncbi:uncharacterized protein LOC105212012 [Zeugodacus cucurbitae]|uniref:Tyrosine-protein kinase Lyn n=1 Tax=Zeugodacus cucurbitae TaxID=28588 RepID=A0A0A1WZM1_ZEUCU|nr:uncharacterized protein LOC105212012 [Zeugodacus cucurbitae]XP_054088129.1 uncharacterized protein LOC105212012 [Zeugodacus cucurbitae]XP_054088130.1 uncharacterized protein LOC105212012 [Zeugodacus cucurbitae]XP_054088131.1 uncharacterized protein LOC105212012 [Zeugodacus cucurbitae]XP_054088132.1 uncharacterized protein LOC105212012 [Zeugodacus cucurbitae]